jgi:hypothetical protein
MGDHPHNPPDERSVFGETSGDLISGANARLRKIDSRDDQHRKFGTAREANFHSVGAVRIRRERLDARKEGTKAMLDSIFAVSTVIFFGFAMLYVKFCNGLR